MKADNDASDPDYSLVSRALVYLNWYVREVARACVVHVGVTTVLAILGLCAAGTVYVYRNHIYGSGVTIEQPQPKIERAPITDGWGAKVKPALR